MAVDNSDFYNKRKLENLEGEDKESSGGSIAGGSTDQTGNIEGPFLFRNSENTEDLFFDKGEQENSSALAKQLVKEIRAEGRKRGLKYKETAKQSFKQEQRLGSSLSIASGGRGATEKHPALEDMHGKRPTNVKIAPGEDIKDKSITNAKKNLDNKNKNKLKKRLRMAPNSKGGVKKKKDYAHKIEKPKSSPTTPRLTPGS